MNNILYYMESNAEGILWILIAVIIADIIIHVFTGRKQSFKKSNMVKKEQSALIKLQEAGDEAYILLQSKDKICVYVSDNIETIAGMKPQSVYADTLSVLQGFSKKEQRNIRSLLEKWNGENALVFDAPWRKNDHEIHCQMRIIKEAHEGYDLIILRDISAQKAELDKLEKEIQEAKKSEESKTTFLSNMSHEIRTPLNGMLGMIGLAKMNLDDKNAVGEYLEKAEDLSSFLLSVINDILDMSRIESGKTELEEIAFDIRGMANKLGNMFRTTLEEKKINFDLELMEVKEPYVIGDELRISQVLTNFLSNASKFTPEGGQVTLLIRQMDVVQDKVAWMFRVKDTGKGMTPAFLHRIFMPFEQEDSGISRKYGGSGLGMAISDNLVRLMGGQILVESEVGKGSTFTVFVKLPKADEKAIAGIAVDGEEKEAADLNGRRILLAEDKSINALIVVKMLATQGIEVEVAKNGVEAVDMFENHEENYYDAILMDIQMPEMNGWEASRRIRVSKKMQGAAIPIFALSADAFVEDKRKSAEAGMNGHITKPIDYNELKKILQMNLGNRNL